MNVSITIEPEALRPLVREIVDLALARLAAATAKVPDRLAYSEAEAARLLGLKRHQLRDERLRSRIAFCRLVGGRVFYTRQALMDYLMRDNGTRPA